MTDSDQNVKLLTSAFFHDAEIRRIEFMESGDVSVVVTVPNAPPAQIEFANVRCFLGKDVKQQNVIARIECDRLSMLSAAEIVDIVKRLGGGDQDSYVIGLVKEASGGSVLISIDSHIGFRFAVVCDRVEVLKFAS